MAVRPRCVSRIQCDPAQVPIMSQNVPENTGGTVVWDYHVIAVERDGHTSVVYDLTRYYHPSSHSFQTPLSSECLIISPQMCLGRSGQSCHSVCSPGVCDKFLTSLLTSLAFNCSILPRPCLIARYAREALGPANTWRFNRSAPRAPKQASLLKQMQCALLADLISSQAM